MRGHRVPGLVARSDNATENLARAKIASGFGFWNNTAGFDISQTLIEYSARPRPTAARSGSACSTRCWSRRSASCLRPSSALSSASRGCRRTGWWRGSPAGYVEIIRNMPLLLQLLFWYNAVLKALPDMRDSWTHAGRRLPQQPRPVSARSRSSQRRLRAASLVAFVVGIVGAIAYRIWARKRQERTGQQSPVFWSRSALIVGLPLVVFVAAGLAADVRVSRDRAASTSAAASKSCRNSSRCCSGSSLYTAAFIAEVVRAGILAVSHGPDRGRLCARPARRADAAAGRDPAGDARHHPAADQPVSQPDQELLARGRHRLSRPRADLHRHGAQPDRPGGRGRRITMAVYLTISLVTSVLMNLYNRASRWWSGEGHGGRSARQRSSTRNHAPSCARRRSRRCRRRWRMTGAFGWLRANLFSCPLNIALTLLCVAADRLDRSAADRVPVHRRGLDRRRPRGLPRRRLSVPNSAPAGRS